MSYNNVAVLSNTPKYYYYLKCGTSIISIVLNQLFRDLKAISIHRTYTDPLSEMLCSLDLLGDFQKLCNV
jgi:hypothetical protein